MTGPSVDGVLVEWGERLFYPSNRIVASREARLRSGVGARAAVIRDRIRATVVRRAPQVMVKVTGGGRGMAAIAAHFRYIAKAGRLPLEDDRGVVREGKAPDREVLEALTADRRVVQVAAVEDDGCFSASSARRSLERESPEREVPAVARPPHSRRTTGRTASDKRATSAEALRAGVVAQEDRACPEGRSRRRRRSGRGRAASLNSGDFRS